VCKYDDLWPSGDLLATQLEESGVPVHRYLAQGTLHGHLNRAPSLAEVDRTLAVTKTTDFARGQAGSSTLCRVATTTAAPPTASAASTAANTEALVLSPTASLRYPAATGRVPAAR